MTTTTRRTIMITACFTALATASPSPAFEATVGMTSEQAESLTKCQKTVAQAGEKVAQTTARSVTAALTIVATGVIGAAAEAPPLTIIPVPPSLAEKATKKLAPIRAPGEELMKKRSLGAAAASVPVIRKFETKAMKACDPATNPHTEAQVLGNLGAATGGLDVRCGEPVTDVEGWIGCRSREAFARGMQAAGGFPGAPRLLDDLKVAVEQLGTDTTLAPDVVLSVNTTIEEAELIVDPDGDDILDAGCPALPTPTPARYVDNGDGTITDNDTALMWEAKDRSGGIHDEANIYSWSHLLTPSSTTGTVYLNFLATLNTVPCFAGHCDWRLPTLAELTVLYPIPDEFDSNCADDCVASACSCTYKFAPYWSSDTYIDNNFYAHQFDFDFGFASVAEKVNGRTARAVRP